MSNVRVFLIVLLAVLSLEGCVGAPREPISWQDEQVYKVWPDPPDKPRIRYLRSLSGAQDFKESNRKSGFMNWLLGERQDDLPFFSPYAIAVSQNEIIWVADSGSRMLYRMDLVRQQVSYFKELAGLQLIAPSGVTVDDERQRIYVADSAYNKIFVLDQEGNYLSSWGPETGFERPVGLAVNKAGQLMVADVLDGRVFLFDPQGQLISKIGSKINPDGRYDRPLAVAFGPTNEVLVLDAMSFRVEVQSAQGELIGTIGQLGDAAGYLARPKGLAVDQEGHVFISDAAFDNIQIFDLTGKLLLYFGKTGNQPGEFNLPAGLFVDRERRLFAADSYNHRVQVFELLP